MAIQYSDIKLMKSERLDDSEVGGGRMTGNEVVDGEINNLFPDISRLDRVYGRVQLRKAFAAVLTDTTNPFYGGQVIITKPATDEKVKCCICTTESSTDVRKDAIERIESYVTQGYRLFSWMLMGKHVQGSQILLVQQDVEDELPSVNSVLYLEEKNGTNGEYVKIRKVEVQKEDSRHRQVKLSLWAPTQYDHAGFHYDNSGRTVIDTYFYTTIVQDAMHYYSIKKLVSPAKKGDSVIKVDDIFHNLVPCAQSAAALSNRDATGIYGSFQATNADNAEYTFVGNEYFTVVNGVITIYCGRGLLPGSVSVNHYKDDGNGHLPIDSGTVDYETGKITLQHRYGSSYHVTVKAIPAVKPRIRRCTGAYPITAETQTSVLAVTLLPKPAAGSVKIKYKAQGNWYVLSDNGDGTISGAVPAFGSGTIDYATGSVNVTLGALPDLDSAVLFSWGTSVNFYTKSAFNTDRFYIEFQTEKQIAPGTVTIRYTAGGVTRTVTDNNGNLQGDGTGKVFYSEKRIVLEPDYIPDAGSTIQVSYNETADEKQQTFAITELIDNGDGTLTANLGESIVAGSLNLSFQVKCPVDDWDYSVKETTIVLRDDGNGHFIGDDNSFINYDTGEVTFSKCHTVETYRTRWIAGYVFLFLVREEATASFCPDNDSQFVFKYTTAAATTQHEETVTGYHLKVVISDVASEIVIPKSLILELNGHALFDDEGKLYDGIDHATGQWGAQVGTVDYEGGLIELIDWGWANGIANDGLIVKGLLYTPQEITTAQASFVTDAYPVQVGSFQIVFTRADTGEQKAVFADNSGQINGDGVWGSIDYQTGIVNVKFGVWVPNDANAQSQPWYDPDNVVGDQVLKPIGVYAESIKYNAVAIEYIPLDPSILGLNPLRLPTDGRVPVFRKGDVVVIHNIQQFTMPDNLTAGQQVILPRGDLSYVDLFDQNGKYVDKQWYSVDLENGIITMSDPLDLSAYTQPLIAYHRREDMRLLSDVQIDGTLKLIQPIEHDYDTDYTYVSSALLMGDLYASVYNVFDQKNWTGKWSDELIGDPCTANYDTVHYPIEVTNKGAIHERWAIIFKNSTDFKVVGETVGEIASGNINEDCAPINPATGVPYFVIRKEGWGSGWATNNVLRFNTTAAHFPIWFIRTVLIGDATAEDDNFRIQIRGDVD